MKHSKLKKALSLLLSLALVLPLTALPASAGQFRDVTDSQTSMAADVLSALGIVNGTGNGEFSPDGHLTRDQLCKMAVLVLGMGDKVESQAYRTIFTDMGSKHWARGYVNLAATTEVPEGSGARLMLGLGNGTFGPDREITYQEAVTLALRILGYGEEANRAWPSGALQTAARLGLDADLNIIKPTDPITRGQTALMFYRLLATPAKGGEQPFAAGMGDLVDDVIVLSTNATVNNQSGWVITAQGGSTTAYRPTAPVDSSLVGLRGAALLDEEGRFVTLLPDRSSYVSAAVTQIQGYYLYLAGRGRYTMPEDTPVYSGASYDSSVTAYKDYMASLRVGDVVTLYLDGAGKVTGLFRSEASPESGFIVVRSTPVNAYSFLPLTGGEQVYTVRKNGATISLSDIKQYDVVTYDPISRVLDVCDVRLTCVYENAYPSPESPSTVTAAGGNTFTVLADAASSFYGRRLGDSITLLLTSNGMVAGVLNQSGWDGWGYTSSNALGVLVGDEFQLLGCSKTLHLNEASKLQLQGYATGLFNAYSAQRGILSLQSAGSYSGGQFSLSNMTLGSTRVSPGVRIYERLSGGVMKARSLSDLPANVSVIQYHVDSSGLVDLIIIGSYSGDGVEYRRIDVLNGYKVKEIDPGFVPDFDDPDYESKFQYPTYERTSAQQVSVDGGEPIDVADGRHLTTGYAQISVDVDGTVAYANYLRAIFDVPSSAFYTQDGVTYVQTSQGVLQVADDVQCYNIAASYSSSTSLTPPWMNNGMWSGNLWQGEWPENWPMQWFPSAPTIVKFPTLSDCRNFSSTLTLYVDSVGQRVRVIEAQ